MISWDRLRILAHVAEEGSVHGAARLLHLTPSAVSQHLRRLEAETGRRLVAPRGRGIRLTQDGIALAAVARQMRDAADHAPALLEPAPGRIAGPMRIGSLASPVRGFLPEALERLAIEHPDAQPELDDGETDDLLRRVREGDLDLAIVES